VSTEYLEQDTRTTPDVIRGEHYFPKTEAAREGGLLSLADCYTGDAMTCPLNMG
jgi:hypothetical protein